MEDPHTPDGRVPTRPQRPRWTDLPFYPIIGFSLILGMFGFYVPISGEGDYSTVGLILVAASSAIGLAVSIRLMRPYARQEQRPLIERRIRTATQAMTHAAALVDELQAEIAARTATLDRVRAEHQRYEELAAIRKEEAAAVTRLVETVIANTHAWLGRSNRLYFVAGVLATVVVAALAQVVAILLA